LTKIYAARGDEGVPDLLEAGLKNPKFFSDPNMRNALLNSGYPKEAMMRLIELGLCDPQMIARDRAGAIRKVTLKDPVEPVKPLVKKTEKKTERLIPADDPDKAEKTVFTGKEYNDAVKAAAKQRKPLLLHFMLPDKDCIKCKQLRLAWEGEDPTIRDAAKDFIVVHINGNESEDLVNKYKLKGGFPQMLVAAVQVDELRKLLIPVPVTKDGTDEPEWMGGFKPADKIKEYLEKVGSKAKRIIEAQAKKKAAA